MTYHVIFEKEALKSIKKLDRQVQILLKNWIERNLEGTVEPRRFGKALVGNFKGYWRYRVGDYRIICEIKDDKLMIIVLEVGYRKEI